MQLFHGLSAFRGTRNPIQQVQAADACIGKEICTADRPIGPIGIMVTGTVSQCYSRDVWSYLDGDGKRHADPEIMDWYDAPREAGDDGVDLDDSAALESWIKTYRERDYIEAFHTADRITAVWIKDWADDTTRKAARIIARRHGCRVHVVHGHTRPWDVVGAYYDPASRFYDMAAELGYQDYA